MRMDQFSPEFETALLYPTLPRSLFLSKVGVKRKPIRCRRIDEKQSLSARTIWKFCLLEWFLQLGLLDNC